MVLVIREYSKAAGKRYHGLYWIKSALVRPIEGDNSEEPLSVSELPDNTEYWGR
jgi:hypothetical protein